MVLRARPKTATTPARTMKPETVPVSVARQPRVIPTPTTIVTISMASTVEARNVVTSTRPRLVMTQPPRQQP